MIFKNGGGRLIDMGDDVGLVEFEWKRNGIGVDVIEMMNGVVDEVEENYRVVVIGKEGKKLCVG
ncbi:hypothetical protein, partial [Bacillus pumilus]|uniref:hypothetical protein n=1 Tax=Bacillus pumilus TaxID=1408 RepID=UPI0011A8A3EC